MVSCRDVTFPKQRETQTSSEPALCPIAGRESEQETGQRGQHAHSPRPGPGGVGSSSRWPGSSPFGIIPASYVVPSCVKQRGQHKHRASSAPGSAVDVRRKQPAQVRAPQLQAVRRAKPRQGPRLPVTGALAGVWMGNRAQRGHRRPPGRSEVMSLARAERGLGGSVMWGLWPAVGEGC